MRYHRPARVPTAKKEKRAWAFHVMKVPVGKHRRKKRAKAPRAHISRVSEKLSDSSSWKSSETGTDWEKRNNMRNRQVSRTRHCRVYTLCGQVSEREFPIEHEEKVEGDQTDPRKTGG